MEFKTLFQKTKTGAINSWRVYTKGSMIFTEFGQLGGKMQTTCGTECIATNVGRSNERNPEQQAIFEAEALIKKQLRLKYSETIEEAEKTRIQVQLALDGHEIKFDFPVDIQVKYDGGRTLTIDEERILFSRGNKIYPLKHITEELKAMFPDDVMTDGELYLHGVPLQTIMSYIKKSQIESNDIEYHIYDLPSNKCWAERKALLNTFKSSAHIKIVETFVANNVEELNAFHDKFVAAGFEGAILRINDPEVGYEFGKRSALLLKYKAFEDAEFKIIGMVAGTGKYSETPVFICQNDKYDNTFRVVPKGTMEEKKAMFTDENIGKMLTVEFLGRTEDGKPKIAVGKGIRAIEDMPQKET